MILSSWAVQSQRAAVICSPLPQGLGILYLQSEAGERILRGEVVHHPVGVPSWSEPSHRNTAREEKV